MTFNIQMQGCTNTTETPHTRDTIYRSKLLGLKTIKESYVDSIMMFFFFVFFNIVYSMQEPETDSSIPQFYDARCQSSLILTECNCLETWIWWWWCWKNCYPHLPGPLSTIGVTQTLNFSGEHDYVRPASNSAIINAFRNKQKRTVRGTLSNFTTQTTIFMT